MREVTLSTAQQIIKTRREKKSHLSAITSKDLMCIYQSLKKIPGKPNFKNVEKLLPESYVQPPPGGQSPPAGWSEGERRLLPDNVEPEPPP